MRRAGLWLLAALSLHAAEGPHFDITDERGKKPAGVSVEAGAADADGWFSLNLIRGKAAKGDPVLVWPFDGAAKAPDGPEPIPIVVIARGDAKALANRRVVAAMAVPWLLGLNSADTIANKFDLDPTALKRAIQALTDSTDSFEKGIGLSWAGKHADAADAFAQALKERRNQLTPMPSEIYAAAILYGEELSRANKFDDAAAAFLMAQKQRPSDQLVRGLRADALIRAGKPDAVER